VRGAGHQDGFHLDGLARVTCQDFGLEAAQLVGLNVVAIAVLSAVI
jgi:hypothetical protein